MGEIAVTAHVAAPRPKIVATIRMVGTPLLVVAQKASIAGGCATHVRPVTKARIFAMVIPHGPLRMFADPLRNIELRRHCTLLQRTLPGELKALFLAQVGLP